MCEKIKGLNFISNRQLRKEGTFCASELVEIEPTPPAPEEQGNILEEKLVLFPSGNFAGRAGPHLNLPGSAIAYMAGGPWQLQV
jgi:hypothetical protein